MVQTSHRPDERVETNARQQRSNTCVVTPETLGPFKNGGVGTAAYRLAQLLARHGHQVTLLYTGTVVHRDRAAWQKRYYDEVGIRIVVLEEWVAPDEMHDVEAINPIDTGATPALRVHAYLRRQSFDVVYLQEFMGHGLRAVQAWRGGLDLKGVRLVMWCHSSQLWSMEGNDRHVASRGDLVAEAHERIGTRLCDVVATPSQYMATWIRQKWKIDDVRFLPYWYLWREIDQRLRERVTHRGFSHLVFFGRLERRKGLDLLLGALKSSSLLRSRIKRLSFLGRQIEIDGRRSADYIADALRGSEVPWDVVDGYGTDEALAWLAEQEEVLVVAPSVLDNFPFVIIELLETRTPFLSTHVGGIPEVVGRANVAELLMEPTVSGVRAKLESVLSEQTLVIDYRESYDPEAAERTVLEFHARLLAESGRKRVQPEDIPKPSMVDAWVIVGDDTTSIEGTLSNLTVRCCFRLNHVTFLVSRSTPDADILRLGSFLDEGAGVGRWRSGGVISCDDFRPALGSCENRTLLIRAGEALTQDGFGALDAALELGEGACVCGYVRRPSRPGSFVQHFEHRPMGGALELGMLEEVSLTTPLLVHPRHSKLLAEKLREHQGRVHQVLQAFACALVQCSRPGVEPVWVVPKRVADGPALPLLSQRDRARLTRIYREYQSGLSSELLFPLAFAGVGMPRHSAGGVSFSWRAGAYPQLAAVESDVLESFLKQTSGDDAVSRIVARIGPLLPHWAERPPQLYIYGAGEHTKVLLCLFPMLWSWVVAFIDGRRTESFLGRPCRHPGEVEFTAEMTVLYSSREFEATMYQRLCDTPATHVKIYGEVA